MLVNGEGGVDDNGGVAGASNGIGDGLGADDVQHCTMPCGNTTQVSAKRVAKHYRMSGCTAQLPKMVQAGPWGWNLDIPVPKWLLAAIVLEDESESHEGAAEGEDKPKPELPITDFIALVIGVGAASVDVALGHGSFTLCNLLACVIATDIMQARPCRTCLWSPWPRLCLADGSHAPHQLQHLIPQLQLFN